MRTVGFSTDGHGRAVLTARSGLTCAVESERASPCVRLAGSGAVLRPRVRHGKGLGWYVRAAVGSVTVAGRQGQYAGTRRPVAAVLVGYGLSLRNLSSVAGRAVGALRGVSASWLSVTDCVTVVMRGLMVDLVLDRRSARSKLSLSAESWGTMACTRPRIREGRSRRR